MSITITFTDLSRDDLSRIVAALSSTPDSDDFRNSFEAYGVELPNTALAPTHQAVKFPTVAQTDDNEISEEDEAMLNGLAGIPNTDDLDAAGLPWNEAEHASTKTKTKDGFWKKRKVFGNTQEAVDVPPAPIVPPPPVQVQGLAYPDVVTRIMGGITQNKFNYPSVDALLKQYNIQNLTGLEHRPEIFTELLAKLGV